MTHYSEDKERDDIALRCIKAIQPYRNKNVEFILVCNGFYEGLRQYCDKYFEREADASPGRSGNIGFNAGTGNILIGMSNDVLVTGDWIEECKEIVNKYPKHLATPLHIPNRKWHELPMVDGHCVNLRAGSNIMCMTRKQYEDIGPYDEFNPDYDGINYINRWIKKGYAMMMTTHKLAFDLGKFKHCYLKQQAKMGYKKSDKPK
jgi:hypothetical protein